MDGAELRSLMRDSDLHAILDRLSGNAWNRYHHLQKNPAKTEQKIYPTPGS